MAVSAKFIADFTSFQSAVQKAELSLKSFESEAGRVEKSLNRVGDSFSGRRVIQDAELATAAIREMGGASTLTEREQERLNASLTEALAKYKALGLQAPAAMVDLANATAKVPEKLSLIDRGMNALKGTFGQVFSAFTAANLLDRAVSGFVNLGKEAVKAAGDTLDLANKTGLSTDSIQRMGFVAKQTGTDMEAFTRAAFMLGVNLEKGKGGIDGLKASFEELKALRPDQQFAEVVKQLEAIEDPQKRNEIAVRLFGKSAQEILPAIAEGYTQIADKAKVAERAQLEAVDKMSDAWDAFVQNTKTSIASWLGQQVVMTEQMSKLTLQQRVRLEQLERSGMSTADALKKIFPPDVNLPFEGTVKNVTEATTGLRTEARATAPVVRDLAREMEAFAAQITKANQVTRRDGMMAESLRGLQALIRGVRQELMLISPVTRDWVAANEATTATLVDMVSKGMHLPALTDKQKKAFTEARAATEDWRDELNQLAQAMTYLSQTSGNSFIAAISTMVNGINVGTQAVEALKKGFDNLTSGGGLGSILKGFTGIVSGIGGVVSAAQAAISIGKALFNIFDRDKGRDLVEDFVQQFGGFDGIQKIFAEMGEEGHRLWVMLTQGVGRNNPDQARRAIEEVTRAIEEFRRQAQNIPPITFEVNRIDRTDRGVDIDPSSLAASGGEQVVINMEPGVYGAEQYIVDTLTKAVRRQGLVGAV